MQIYQINSINFTSKYNKKIDKESLEKLKVQFDNSFKRKMYSDISMFVDGKLQKKEYLRSVDQFIRTIDDRKSLNDAEKQYLGDMLATMDSSPKDKIPEKYILENISRLIKNQQ